jgi:hypothetical protein
MDHRLKIDFDRAYRLAVCRPVELLGSEQLGQVLDFLLAFEDRNPEPFDRLLDLTEVTDIQVSRPAISEYASARRKATAKLPPFRTAIIARDPAAAEFARVYAWLMEGSKIQVGICRDTKSAAVWLGMPEAVIRSEIAKQK